MELKERAKEIFANHSAHDTVHFTSDGQPFFKHHDAWNHSHSLKDKTITRIEKDDMDKATNNHDDKAAAVRKLEFVIIGAKTIYNKYLQALPAKKEELDKAIAAAGAEGADDKAKKASEKLQKAYDETVAKSNEALTKLQTLEAELAKLQGAE
ncbi:hypothetical protein [Mucilaginibacter sp. L3T2-6]|uniref:hypothetical protein n=1 Tax=Mucilaginibacter sp. L3T2-6 TaxID=3062491 RepID=UPI002674F419|nr:hypothetical protein [Mucilaginibacter sp. L3T2-6]MDO3641974.1 hypothetical protein [Mucilaginibacter sp. L3T2-6]MDV6214348.1 hypothetical protein [Mucilaginibacter sp. L3T2-6]